MRGKPSVPFHLGAKLRKMCLWEQLQGKAQFAMNIPDLENRHSIALGTYYFDYLVDVGNDEALLLLTRYPIHLSRLEMVPRRGGLSEQVVIHCIRVLLIE
jgi:hypothetical protein